MFMGRFVPGRARRGQYRRSLYAFWRRAIAPTSLHDSAQRRVCDPHLAHACPPGAHLLGDETYPQASRALAAQMLQQPGDATARLQFLSRRVLSRAATSPELAVLQRELDRALQHYRAHPEDAAKFIQAGQAAPQPPLDPAALAAHMVVASLMLNLDEAITHE
jgi:hypothetical protein